MLFDAVARGCCQSWKFVSFLGYLSTFARGFDFRFFSNTAPLLGSPYWLISVLGKTVVSLRVKTPVCTISSYFTSLIFCFVPLNHYALKNSFRGSYLGLSTRVSFREMLQEVLYLCLQTQATLGFELGKDFTMKSLSRFKFVTQSKLIAINIIAF